MSRHIMRGITTTFLAAAAISGCNLVAGNGPLIQDEILEAIRELVQGGAGGNDKTITVASNNIDLNGDGVEEVVAYLSGDSTCGSGGCDAYILSQDRGRYKVVTKLTISWLPIRLLETSTNGWRDLGVWVQGGGIQPGYEAKLRFDGKTYPINPTIVTRTTGNVGKVLIDESTRAIPLYD